MILTDPLTTIYGWKRFLGRNINNEYVSRYRDRFPFRIHEDEYGSIGAVIQDRVISFTDIAAMVLQQVREQTSAAARADVRRCVISIPAHFGKAQRNAVLEAGRRAGLNVMRLINEPTAAALAFGMERRLDSRILVYDLGGGTFDATVLELVDNVFDVKATLGHPFLGGMDFDRAVMQHLIAHCKRSHKIDVDDEPIVAQRILNAAENAKISLSEEQKVRVQVPMIGYDHRGNHVDLDLELSRAELEALTAPLVEQSLGIVEKMLRDAQLADKNIDHVVLVGGQTRMPLVRQRLEAVLGIKPLCHLDPDVCIAHGAALVAKSPDDVDGALLLDVLSVPIGVVFPGGRTQFLFESNRSLPAKTRLALEPPANDRDVILGLWQGADVTSAERQVLGLLRISPSLFNGNAACELDLTLSEDLEITATFRTVDYAVPINLEAAPGSTQRRTL